MQYGLTLSTLGPVDNSRQEVLKHGTTWQHKIRRSSSSPSLRFSKSTNLPETPHAIDLPSTASPHSFVAGLQKCRMHLRIHLLKIDGVGEGISPTQQYLGEISLAKVLP
jgi:hypothetical protein